MKNDLFACSQWGPHFGTAIKIFLILFIIHIVLHWTPPSQQQWKSLSVPHYCELFEL